MRFRKNRLCKIFLLILFMAFISGGCGGGSSGSGGNSQGNNGGKSTEINGTWEIVSGYAVISRDHSGKIETYNFTYAGKNEPVEIEMTDVSG